MAKRGFWVLASGLTAMALPRGVSWGINATSVGRLQRSGAPFALLLIVAYVASLHQEGIVRTLDMVEVFAGEGALTNAFDTAGMYAKDYDLRHNVITNDITSDLGFLHAVYLVQTRQTNSVG